jgi:hypothetical protein
MADFCCKPKSASALENAQPYDIALVLRSALSKTLASFDLHDEICHLFRVNGGTGA